MLFILLFSFFQNSKCSFQDYFEIEDPIIFTGYNPTVSLQTGSFYFNFCFFENLSSKAIIIQITSLINFMIESTSFLKCSSTGEGGAISFKCTNGEIILSKICAAFCSALGSNCNFALLENSGTLRNNIYFSSIT